MRTEGFVSYEAKGLESDSRDGLYNIRVLFEPLDGGIRRLSFGAKSGPCWCCQRHLYGVQLFNCCGCRSYRLRRIRVSPKKVLIRHHGAIMSPEMTRPQPASALLSSDEQSLFMALESAFRYGLSLDGKG